MKVTFKPVYRYQSAEFTVDIGEEMDLGTALETYEMLLEGIKAVASKVCPDEGAPKIVSKKDDKPKVELATDKQKAIMVKFDIPYNSRTTKAEARELISKSLGQQE